jgi:organic hydroperoxide reductase OsmC/OhrA
MNPLPHRYNVTLTSGEQSYPIITSDRLEPFTSAPPENFDGPGNLWSPETLLVAAVADCFALTFREVAKASQLRWTKLLCDADGTLDRSEGVTRLRPSIFTCGLSYRRRQIPRERAPCWKRLRRIASLAIR